MVQVTHCLTWGVPGISAKESSSPPAVSSLLEGEGELTMAGGALVGGEGEAFTWVPALLSATCDNIRKRVIEGTD